MSVEQTNEQIETFAPESIDIKVQEIRKEATAKAIAKHLLATFRWTILAVMALGFIAVFCDEAASLQGRQTSLVKDSVAPLLTGIGAFASTLFGPLLGFVLGYYFAERSKRS